MATIFTTHGEMDEDLLVKTEGCLDNDVECTKWVEYRLGDEIVRRDVHMHLKQGFLMEGVAQHG